MSTKIKTETTKSGRVPENLQGSDLGLKQKQGAIDHGEPMRGWPRLQLAWLTSKASVSVKIKLVRAPAKNIAATSSKKAMQALEMVQGVLSFPSRVC